MPRVMMLPRPPPPTKAANTAEPMALTTAMRTPVNTMGKARGNSTFSSRYIRLMPMPRAASFTPESTSWSPKQVLRTMGSREYSVMPNTTVTLPAPRNTIRIPSSARDGTV